MQYKLFEQVFLTQDIPHKNLRCGDVATIVDYHPLRNGEDGYSLEIFNALGDTIAVITVARSLIQPVLANQILSVRSLHLPIPSFA
jgi:hypothetical protein